MGYGQQNYVRHSLQTGEDFAIGPTPHTLDSFFGTYHAIDDNKVAWTKFNANDYTSELHLYDLTTRTDRQLDQATQWFTGASLISAEAGLVTYNDAGPGLSWIIYNPPPQLFPLPHLLNI